MTSFSNLKYAIADPEPPCQDREGEYIMTIARRLLELFDECPGCFGWGWVEIDSSQGIVTEDCPRCGGSGAVPKQEACGWWVHDGHNNEYILMDDLARFLFGEEEP